MYIVNEMRLLNPAAPAVMNQFTPRDTMTRLSNEDVVDMHMAYGVVNGNARAMLGRIKSIFLCLDIAC